MTSKLIEKGEGSGRGQAVGTKRQAGARWHSRRTKPKPGGFGSRDAGGMRRGGGRSWRTCSPTHAPCSAPPRSRNCLAESEKTAGFPGELLSRGVERHHQLLALPQLLGTTTMHAAFYIQAGEKALLPPTFSTTTTLGFLGRPQGSASSCLPPPPLSAAEWLSGTCIIYLLGNIYWDLVFNNCHSNISFLNPLRSVAVAILNIYQRSLCVHC